MALNDEGHHCYRRKPGDDDEGRLSREERQEADRNNEEARVWISGLEMVQRRLGVRQVVDLSATPFFLRGSGYAEGTLFPWTVSDFSLMDAIECGIVKLPRVPVADNIPGERVPVFRNLWEHIRGDMPRAGRGRNAYLDPLDLPVELQTALEALYGHYKTTFEQWQASGATIPPCFIVVCNNTSTSKLVYDYVSGFERENEDGSATLHNGRLELFRNFDEAGGRFSIPRTLLIDSRQLESGEKLSDDFRRAAAPANRAVPHGAAGTDGRPRGCRQRHRHRAAPRGDEHRRQGRPVGRANSLRRVRFHADRRLGRQHRDPRPGRAGLRNPNCSASRWSAGRCGDSPTT